MHRSRSWGAAAFFLGLMGATSHCGGSSGGLLTPADAGPDEATISQGAPRFLVDDASACRAPGAGCTVDADCCAGSCIANVCGGAGAPDASPGSAGCRAASATCARGFDCCSGTCSAGACAGGAPAITPGGSQGTGGACIAPSASCTTSPQCCSGLCEPVTGRAGVVECRDACRANGVACTTAQDCCSLGCFGGVCVDKLCAIVDDACAANADCCSGVCDPMTMRCGVDLANSTCRPTGEDCGKGPQSGCCGATHDNDLCGQDGRCVLPPGACRGQKASCADDTDCCSRHCDPASKTCTVVCAPIHAACKTGADCCTSSCTNGTCDGPRPPSVDAGSVPSCAPIGSACTGGASCCSALCLAGFCDQAAPPR